MDGEDLREASHERAVEVIRKAGNPVTFLVQSLVDWVLKINRSTTLPIVFSTKLIDCFFFVLGFLTLIGSGFDG